MNSVDLIKRICKERRIPISRLERELGYGNGYISQLRKGTVPSDRAVEIAKYLGIDLQYLLSGGEVSEMKESEFTARDKRDIAKDLDRIMNEIESDEDGPLYYNGEPIAGKKLDLLRNAIEVALEDAKKKNKETFRPYKYKARPEKGKAPADGE